MHKLNKWSLIFSTVITLILLVLGIVAKSYISKEMIIAKIENNFNTRVEIKNISIPIFMGLWPILLENVKIKEHDRENNKPYNSRTPIKEAKLSIAKVNLNISFWKLLSSGGNSLSLDAVTLHKPQAKIVLRSDFTTSIDKLFLNHNAKILKNYQLKKLKIKNGSFSIKDLKSNITWVLKNNEIKVKKLLVRSTGLLALSYEELKTKARVTVDNKNIGSFSSLDINFKVNLNKKAKSIEIKVQKDSTIDNLFFYSNIKNYKNELAYNFIDLDLLKPKVKLVKPVRFIITKDKLNWKLMNDAIIHTNQIAITMGKNSIWNSTAHNLNLKVKFSSQVTANIIENTKLQVQNYLKTVYLTAKQKSEINTKSVMEKIFPKSSILLEFSSSGIIKYSRLKLTQPKFTSVIAIVNQMKLASMKINIKKITSVASNKTISDNNAKRNNETTKPSTTITKKEKNQTRDPVENTKKELSTIRKSSRLQY